MHVCGCSGSDVPGGAASCCRGDPVSGTRALGLLPWRAAGCGGSVLWVSQWWSRNRGLPCADSEAGLVIRTAGTLDPTEVPLPGLLPPRLRPSRVPQLAISGHLAGCTQRSRALPGWGAGVLPTFRRNHRLRFRVFKSKTPESLLSLGFGLTYRRCEFLVFSSHWTKPPFPRPWRGPGSPQPCGPAEHLDFLLGKPAPPLASACGRPRPPAPCFLGRLRLLPRVVWNRGARGAGTAGPGGAERRRMLLLP